MYSIFDESYSESYDSYDESYEDDYDDEDSYIESCEYPVQEFSSIFHEESVVLIQEDNADIHAGYAARRESELNSGNHKKHTSTKAGNFSNIKSDMGGTKSEIDNMRAIEDYNTNRRNEKKGATNTDFSRSENKNDRRRTIRKKYISKKIAEEENKNKEREIEKNNRKIKMGVDYAGRNRTKYPSNSKRADKIAGQAFKKNKELTASKNESYGMI